MATGNDADADRHGIVTPDGGLMNPNHYLSVAIEYLCGHRPAWTSAAAIGKTLVSSSMIDRVVREVGRTLTEVPVGFKWFVAGLLDGSLAFAGEESAGATFLDRAGSVWTTDKDGIVACLLAAEITAVAGYSCSQLYADLTARHGTHWYARIDSPVSSERKTKLANLAAEDVCQPDLAGWPITAKLTEVPGSLASIGGLKITTDAGWIAARPSGTEDSFKLYAESFVGPEHLRDLQGEGKAIVDAAVR